MSLSEIITKYGVENTEKACVALYLKKNKIQFDSHPYIYDYLKDVSFDQELITELSVINHSSLAELAVDMELLIPSEDRETNGAFFTPSYIVDSIINTISPAEDAKVADISCGSGAFLLGIVRYYQTKFNKSVNKIVSDNLHGVDILGYNVRRSKILIILYGLSVGEIIGYDDINVIQANSLTHIWDNRFDAIVGNPPYVKFQDMEEPTLQLLEKNYATTSFGTYNLYFAFFEIGWNLLKDTGMLGYITPNNFFTSLSGESLRSFFSKSQSVKRIVDFSATRVFDVQTYTAITYLTRSKNSVIEYARINNGEDPRSFLSSYTLTDNSYADLNDKKWRLLCGEERSIISAIESAGTPIGSLFNIAVGIATLKDEVYFITVQSEDDSYYYCSNKYCNSLRIEKEATKSLVKISTIKSQKDLHLNSRRIIFPYTVEKGSASIIAEEVFMHKYPECYAYLCTMKDVLAGRGKGKHTYTPFYAYGRTQGLNKCSPKVYTPTFSQYPRFILDMSADSLFTNGYGLFFEADNNSVATNLFDEADNLTPSMDNIDVLMKILNSGLMHFYIKKTSVSIEGGYPCYQKNFIEKFTIPSLSTEDIEALRRFSTKEEIDDYLIRLYQINLPSPNLWV